MCSHTYGLTYTCATYTEYVPRYVQHTHVLHIHTYVPIYTNTHPCERREDFLKRMVMAELEETCCLSTEHKCLWSLCSQLVVQQGLSLLSEVIFLLTLNTGKITLNSETSSMHLHCMCKCVVVSKKENKKQSLRKECSNLVSYSQALRNDCRPGSMFCVVDLLRQILMVYY